ncbi:MAG: DUF2281 domain-containing protein [Cyanobacteria bacterium P01_F01_bin.116]
MASLEQIQQELQILPQEALNLVYQFIQLLKKTIPIYPQQNNTSAPTVSDSESSVYEKFKSSGLIGCVSVEEDLSTTYKQVLAKGWSEKYDHR